MMQASAVATRLKDISLAPIVPGPFIVTHTDLIGRVSSGLETLGEYGAQVGSTWPVVVPCGTVAH